MSSSDVWWQSTIETVKGHFYYSQVFQVPSREVGMGNDLDLSLALLADLHGIAQVSHPSVDLDLVVEKLFERRDVEDLIGGRLRSVDDELFRVRPQFSTFPPAPRM